MKKLVILFACLLSIISCGKGVSSEDKTAHDTLITEKGDTLLSIYTQGEWDYIEGGPDSNFTKRAWLETTKVLNNDSLNHRKACAISLDKRGDEYTLGLVLKQTKIHPEYVTLSKMGCPGEIEFTFNDSIKDLATISTNGEGTVFYIDAGQEFIDKVMTASDIKIQIPTDLNGIAVFDFKINKPIKWK